MGNSWTAVSDGLSLGGYAAWEAAVDLAEGRTPLVPIFVRLKDPGGGLSLAGAIRQTLVLPGVEFARHERDLLETESAHIGDGWPHEVRLVAYGPRSLAFSPPAFWQVLAIGPGFVATPEADPDPSPVGRNLCALSGRLSADVPVLGIIDEGIGFLNTRFRKADGTTRFLGLWLQATERQVQGPVAPRGDIRMGRVLTQAEIDRLLGTRAAEAEVYAQVNRSIFPITERAATSRRVGHGTHVLDIAAGAGGHDPMADVPLLAVQLPPASIRESTGRRMEAHLIQGLRWILAEVLRQADGTKVPPLVLNLSIGTLAGPGDRTEFLADWLLYEIARHARLAPGAQVRIAAAYGNARLWRLAARDQMRIAHPLALDWRVQPDDRTASFIEMRLDTPLTGGVSLVLTPPVGSGLPDLRVNWPTGGTGGGWRLNGASGPVAAATFVAEGGGQSLLHLAIAPTVSLAGRSVAPPGLWRITLTTAENEPVRVVARVQRDDTPDGHAPLGRQSWLDHPEAWGWDPDVRGHVAPARGPVTRQGTAVAHAAAASGNVWLVGAVHPQGGGWRAAPYSGEGAAHLTRPGESVGPGLCAPGDAGLFLRGIPAAGVQSGVTVRLSGTSMAAPAVARRLLEYFRATPASDIGPDAECRALLGKPCPTGAPDARLGHGVLAGS